MNKDMINIDDFVRDKLGGHEEKEDPAAWLRMKELLDKDMPERAVPFWFRMGKPLGFMGCALLVAALCVGGYKMMEHGNRDLAAGNQDRNANGMMVSANKGGDHAVVAGEHAVPAVNGTAATTGPNNNNNPATTASNNTPASNANASNNTVSAAGQHTATASGQAAAGINAGTNKHQQHPNTSNTAQQSSNHNNTAANNAQHHTTTLPSASNSNSNVASAANTNTGAHRSTTGNAGKGTATPATGSANKAAVTANNTPAATVNNAAQKQQATTAANRSQTQGTAATNAGKQQNTAAGTTATVTGTTAAANRSMNKNTRLATSDIQQTGNAPAQPRAYANGGLAETKPDAVNGSKPAIAANNGNNNNRIAAQQQAATGGRDSAASMSVVERTVPSPGVPRKMIRTTDTTGTGKVALAKQTQEQSNNSITTAPETPSYNTAKTTGGTTGPKKTQKTVPQPTAKKEPVLAAQTPATTSATGEVKAPASAVPESKQATTVAEAKKKERADLFGFLRNGHVRDIVNNVKYDVGHAQFYYGVSAGANRSVSSSVGFTGMQLGVTGEFVFNRHLSLMAELKYFNRMGNKKVVNDDYTKVKYDLDSTRAGYNYFTMKTDSTSHFFNFSMLHSFEMPLTLRYAIHKFYIMTGVNLAYYLGINTEEGEKRFANINQQQVVTEHNKPLFTEKKSYVTIDDFGSRFGIGYVFGAGYQINPSLQLDLRMTNSLWDNASTQGAKQVSQNFYKIPSFQLTLGYQFNRDRGKPTFGPTP